LSARPSCRVSFARTSPLMSTASGDKTGAHYIRCTEQMLTRWLAKRLGVICGRAGRVEVKNSDAIVSTFSRHPCTRALGKSESQSTTSCKRQLFLVRQPLKSTQSIALHTRLRLMFSESGFASYGSLAWKRLHQTYSQQWYSRASISRRSGAAAVPCAAPASAKVCSTRTMNRFQGTSSPAR
jgi:hypothetical protein